MNQLTKLYESLDTRIRPEDAAHLVRDILVDGCVELTKEELGLLKRATRRSTYSSMSFDFHRPVGFERQLRTAKKILPEVRVPKDPDDPAYIDAYVVKAGRSIHKAHGANNFKANRLDREERKARGLDISKRQYNKIFRFLSRIEKKNKKLAVGLEKRIYAQVSKSRFAYKITEKDFKSDIFSACFIGYYTARCNLRSVFTSGRQKRPFDTVAEMLFNRVKESPNANWWAIAHVFPNQEVLEHLDDERKGTLLGWWFNILGDIANLLEETWNRSNINRKTMIVRRGDDSSTWNSTAGAWNKARDSWINLIYSLNMDGVLDEVCPGKVLRLMAADVAYWHRSEGGELEPDTQVWVNLPLPWEVLSRQESCNRELIEDTCKKVGLDPVKTGWIAPRPGKMVEKFTLTPELVHGVTVSSPKLAEMIKKAGWFSGKRARSVDIPVNVSRSDDGFATGVSE